MTTEEQIPQQEETPAIAVHAIVVLAESQGLETKSAKTIEELFLPFANQIDDWKAKADAIVISGVDDKENMAAAREARLSIQKVRTTADRERKRMKQDAKVFGDTVQAIYNKIEDGLKTIEESLMEKEKYAEIMEANRILKLREERTAKLLPFNFAHGAFDLGVMDEQAFAMLFAGAEKLYLDGIEAQRKKDEETKRELEIAGRHDQRRLEIASLSEFAPAEYGGVPFADFNIGTLADEEWSYVMEATRQNKANHDAEQERIRLDNERLQKEKDKKDAELKKLQDKAAADKKKADDKLAKAKADAAEKAKAEKDKADLALKAQKEETDRLAKQIKDKADAEVKAAAAAKKAADDALLEKAKEEAALIAAGTKARLNAWLGKFQRPEIDQDLMSNPAAMEIAKTYGKFLVWAQNEINKIQ